MSIFNNTYQASESVAEKSAEEPRQAQVEPMENLAEGQRKTTRKNWIGIKQGKLIVISLHSAGTNKSPAKWVCRCDCGNTKIICSQSLRIGTESCGCKRVQKIKERAKHNRCNTQTYRSWKGMIQRCTNPNNHKYPRYGGRGIQVCDEWKSFAGFFKDMGDCPKGYQIDRINNDGNYNKDNCRWADIQTQARNRSNNRNITMNGQTKTMAEWCEELNVSPVMVRMRISRGWQTNEALTKEPRQWH